VAANVKDELESLDVDDIFDKSGARRDGRIVTGIETFKPNRRCRDQANWTARSHRRSPSRVHVGTSARGNLHQTPDQLAVVPPALAVLQLFRPGCCH